MSKIAWQTNKGCSWE